MIDQFFTPPAVAAELIAQATSSRPRVVFDPAMGNGVLLAASEKRWDIESVVGLDIDPLRVGEARSRRPTWRVGRVDFLSARSRSASRVFRDVRSKVDLAVLNPPFSGRGMSSYPVHTPVGIVRASRAMAFAIVAFHELSAGGELLALLPDGCIIGERDDDARTYLETVAVVDVVERYGRGTFAETAATVNALRVRRRAPRRHETRVVAPGLRLPDITLRLVRGCVPVADASASSVGAEFVHTVHLQDGLVERSSRRATHIRTISSAAVLIPRVGAITPSKVAVFPGDYEIVLSDCVFALVVETTPEAEALRDRLLSSWSNFAALYRGSGAPFVSVARLIDGLRSLGIAAHIESHPAGR